MSEPYLEDHGIMRDAEGKVVNEPVENSKRLLVTGSRTWPNGPAISAALELAWLRLGRGPLTLVHGGAAGADTMAHEAFSKQRPDMFKVEVHPVSDEQWRATRRAGITRNEQMVALGADLLLAFIHNNSRGASHCLRIAQAAGIPAVVYRIDD